MPDAVASSRRRRTFPFISRAALIALLMGLSLPVLAAKPKRATSAKQQKPKPVKHTAKPVKAPSLKNAQASNLPQGGEVQFDVVTVRARDPKTGRVLYTRTTFEPVR